MLSCPRNIARPWSREFPMGLAWKQIKGETSKKHYTGIKLKNDIKK
jgi:hypothetical protein